ncbi:MAG: class I SAM-dependent methyltransferase [Pirellulales bacterium]|nr:class I SAM-dependent methyltransferase [Pirellulales bacterium]
MGLYSTYIFPRMLELALGGRVPTEYRHQALADAAGEVLEIGFGTGLNLACYPRAVARLTVLDPERLLPKKVARRIAAASFPVETAFLDAERLPFESARFDTVVSTWTLCTIPDAAAALGEIRRVLKPNGRFLFLEHGRSDDERVARRQDRWNGLQRVIGCGCNLNRPIDALVSGAGLRIARLERFLMPRTPRLLAEHYLGCATV